MAAISDIITPQVSQAGRRIFAEQLRIAQSHRLKKSGHLVDALSCPSFTVQGSSADSFSATATVPLYLRFLDMKAHGNHRIYNRVVYGILAETKRRIQYGFTDEVLQSLRQQLIKAGATLA